MVDTAKVFMTGRSQAVRLPKAYRFETDVVSIEKLPDGAVVLRAQPQLPLGERLRLILQQVPDDPTFVRPEQPPLERDAAWWDRHGFVPAARKPARGKVKAAVKTRAGGRSR